LKESVNI